MQNFRRDVQLWFYQEASSIMKKFSLQDVAITSTNMQNLLIERAARIYYFVRPIKINELTCIFDLILW